MTPAELYARQHAIYERRMYPIFLRGLRKQIEPVIIMIERGNTDPDLDTLIRPDAMHQPIIQAYDMIGQLAAKREYYAISGMEQKGLIQFLVDKWRLLFHNYALNYAYRIDNDLAETTKNEIRRGLAESYEQNLSVDQTARYIRKQVQGQISRKRAVTIARTEATTASNLGKETGARTWLQEQGQNGYKQWLGRDDGRERDTHIALNDDIIPMDTLWHVGGELAMNPGDMRLSGAERINCYLPDTKIESNIIGGQKSFYSGKVIEIITVTGIRLTVTPNHEILTDNGFVRAKDLTNGDNLVCNLAKQNWFIRLIDNYIYKKPTRADDIFRAIKILWGVQFAKIGALDFNGDAEFMYNEVNIVNANVKLPINGIKMNIKTFCKFLFQTTRTQASLIERFCGFKFSANTGYSTNSGFMSLMILPFSLRFSHFRPFEFLSIGRVSNLNTSRFKSSHEGYTDDTAFITELFHADAGLVSFDKVIEIRDWEYSGHVYDFSSLNGVNIANNIYTSNCRCTQSFMSERLYRRLQAEGELP